MSSTNDPNVSLAYKNINFTSINTLNFQIKTTDTVNNNRITVYIGSEDKANYGVLDDINTVVHEDIPAFNDAVEGFEEAVTDVKEDTEGIKTIVYGENTNSIKCTNSWVQHTLDTSNITGTGVLEFRVYPTSVVDIKTVTGTSITNGNFTNNFTGWVRNDTSKIGIGTDGSNKYVRFTAEASEDALVNLKSLTQESLNFDSINSISFYARKGTPQTDENNGTLVVFVGNKSEVDKGLYECVDNVAGGVDTAHEHITNLTGMIGEDDQHGLRGNISTVQGEITTVQGDIETASTILTYNTFNLNKLLEPSSDLLFAIIVSENNTTKWNNALTEYYQKYNITTSYIYCIANNTFRVKNGDTWSQYNLPSSITAIGITNFEPSTNINLRYIYRVDINRYYEIQIVNDVYEEPGEYNFITGEYQPGKTVTIIGYAWVLLENLNDFLDKTLLFKVIGNHFSSNSHTHGNVSIDGKLIANGISGGGNVVTDSNGKLTVETPISASSVTPSADTTNGSHGSGTDYARANHSHSKSGLYAEASHTHGNLQNDGKVGTTAVNQGVVVTDSSGKITATKGSTANNTSSPQLYYYNGQLSIGG